MVEQLNKIQIRAEVLVVLSQLQANMDAENVDNLLENLLVQEDKQSILEVLVKELPKANEQKAILVCFLLLKLCEKQKLEDSLWDVLKNPVVSDEVKAVILNVLKDMGNKVEYEKLDEYFENPSEVVDADTKRLLQTAIINPEAQIDFLDFLSSLSDSDKQVLLESLGEDYSSDSLANILTPLALYTPTTSLGHLTIDLLGETKSQLALHALDEALKFVEDEETGLLIKRNISKLKIAGVREDNAMEFYREVLSSRPYFSYASYPDGHGNQALIFSRSREDETIQFVAVVVNDTQGLIDCFGFNQISKEDFDRIVDKFYQSDEHVYLNPSVIKTILVEAEKLTRKIENKISYEYLCWKSLLSDIPQEPVPIELILKTNYENKQLSDEDLETIYMFDFLQKWFFDVEYNEDFKALINELNEQVLKNKFDIDFEASIDGHIDAIYTNIQKAVLDKRILMSAYLKYLSEGRTESNEDAQLLYSLYFDEEKKAKLARNIVRKSIYEYYVALKCRCKEDRKMTNIFAMKNKQKITEMTPKQIDSVINIIESIWVGE